MRRIYSLGRARSWRSLFLFIALFAALYGTWSPAAAATGSSPAQHSLFATQQAVQAGPSDLPLPASYGVSAGRFRYFSQTAHFLRGAFLTFWESHGATPVLGLPLTEALDEDGMVVQYLERARLEWHPEISGDPRNQVLLPRLGSVMADARGLTFQPLPSGENTPTSAFFVETGHNLSNAFLSYWLRNGGLAVFGYPISEEMVETNQANGLQYTVQYFERNRFEWHPENPPAFNVQLGLLGSEYAQMVSLNPLARVLLPSAVQGADQDLSDSPRLAELVDSDLLPAIKALGHTAQFRWVPAVIIQNSVVVEFADLGEEGVAGAFITTRSRQRPYVIAIPNTERGESDAALGSVLAHEATHAFDTVTGVISSRLQCSVEEELRAYMNGLASWVLLKGNNALDDAYDPGSLDSAINRSVRGFNSGKPQLDFNFSPQQGRQFLRTLYGSSCGADRFSR